MKKEMCKVGADMNKYLKTAVRCAVRETDGFWKGCGFNQGSALSLVLFAEAMVR